jgi:hypothetical protein
LESATATTFVFERLNLLSFASRYLDALALSAKRCREVTRACVDLAIEGQPELPRMPNLDIYSNLTVYHNPDSELLLKPDDLLVPLLQTFNAPDEIGMYARDEFGVHLRALMEGADPTVQGRALILGLNHHSPLSRLCGEVFPGQADDVDFFAGRLVRARYRKFRGDDDAAELAGHVGGGGLGLGGVPGARAR